MENRKSHWEHIYDHKQPGELSWTQEKPATSLAMIKNCHLPKISRIIDIGGGDSTLVDHLLAEGYKNITVLDLSGKALERAKIRLGADAEKVTWIVSDILDFSPNAAYDIWHDRATFHFFTRPAHVSTYLKIASEAITRFFIIGTFSENGPQRCSGLPVQRYSMSELEHTLAHNFKKINCITENHFTPFKTLQKFTFCRFRKI